MQEEQSPDKQPAAALPPMSDKEFKIYNRLAEHMDMFHSYFRAEWNSLYDACQSGKRNQGQSIRSFIGAGLSFCEHLNFHHGIEERRVFPMLAKKMPAFREQDELVGQHKQIHLGLEKMEKYLEACARGEVELQLGELKTIMDSYGEILWEHLDDEVKTLGAENMRKYWTKKEVQRLIL